MSIDPFPFTSFRHHMVSVLHSHARCVVKLVRDGEVIAEHETKFEWISTRPLELSFKEKFSYHAEETYYTEGMQLLIAVFVGDLEPVSIIKPLEKFYLTPSETLELNYTLNVGD